MTQQELKHYGIMGMHWGVRRGSASRPKKPSAKSLSDAELRTKINRIKMESEYKQLSHPKITRGKKIVTGILLGIATVKASKYFNAVADAGVAKVGETAANLYLKARNGLIPNF